MTVPVPTLGRCDRPSGRQMNRLYPYMIRSRSSPGAVKVSATASSMTTTGPPSRTARRIAASTSTGRGMSWMHSNANAASKRP